MARLLAVRLPIPWAEFGFPPPLSAAGCVVDEGRPSWAWQDGLAPLGIDTFTPPLGTPPFGLGTPPLGTDVPGWGVDHVVLLVPEIEAAVLALIGVGANLRLRTVVRGRPTAFFRVATILEVIEAPVPSPRLYGIALVTDEPLADVAARWRQGGHDVSDPRPAVQSGREILTVRGVDAGFAVMSPERAA